MIFKKLELQGFKTFFDRTEVHFRPGINAVVGPNGCGKSNIADAIRWVLGEQSPKQLRGERMEDLIFSGSEGRHPLGMAEVSLTVETGGEEFPPPYNRFTEVAVTRRLYRSGESEFFINGAACRLRDIRELFLDTGMNPKAYAVISQGSIGDIIKARPEDRRILIEEAAGIAKFKERKNAAVRKLEATEQNLVRIGDLTHEVRRQLGSLQRQARKAERYHALASQLEEAELRVLVHQHEGLVQRLRSAAERVRGLEQLRETLRTEGASLEAALATGSLEAAELEQSLNVLREDFYAHRTRLEGAEQQLAAARTRLEDLRRAAARGGEELERLAALLVSHGSDGARVEGELAELRARLAGSEEAAREASALLARSSESARALRGERDELTARFRDGVRDESATQSRLAHLEARAGALEQEVARVDAELVALEEEDALLAGSEQKLAAALAERRAERAELAGEETRATAALEHARAETLRLDAEAGAAREDLGAASSRLASLSELERSLSGWPARLREELSGMLSRGELNGGLRGLLADALHVRPEHENALEAVLGDRLKCLLVAAPHVGVEAARALRDGDSVRGTFLPLEPRGSEPVAPPAGPGLLGRLADSVDAGAEASPVVARLLQNVFLVESLEAAAPLWEADAGRATWVTPAGDVLWPDGSVTAGPLDPARELLPIVRTIRETRSAADDLEERVAALGTQQEASRELLAAAEVALAGAAAEGRRVDQELGRLEQELLLDRQKRAAHAAQRERLVGLATRTRAEREALALPLESERERRNGLAAERARHEEAIAALEEALAARVLEEKTVLERLGGLQVELAAGRERAAHLETRREHLAAEARRAGARREEVEGEIAAARAAEGEAAASVLELEARRATLLAERDAVEARLAAAQERHREIAGRTREGEERLRGMRARREELAGEIATLQVSLAEEQVRREHLAGRVRELRDCPVEEAVDEQTRQALLEQPLADLEERHAAVSAQIRALGPVNLAAIGDQEELETRLAEQRRQQEDLEQAARDLRQAIQKVNATSREKFIETFEAVSEKFQEVFPQLIDGGSALLRLTEGQDPLDAGVEILAQPAGKKLKHISLLSGGEQALTAIALLLAIFMVKPSPFCLLDEVDAPLDESNVMRFLRALRTSAAGSQLVMITHNKRTMEHAGHLVGVTMADPGVSRLISVQLREVQAQAS